MESGDALIGLSSSGIHSNGFSLVRSLIEAGEKSKEQYLEAAPFDPTRSLGEALMTPTKNYSKSVLALARAGKLKGAAHITSGGLMKSIPRVLPDGLCAELDADSWEFPPVFRWLGAHGKISTQELATTFNCGIGMVLVVAAGSVDDVMRTLKEHDEDAVKIGQLKPRMSDGHAVVIESAESSWLMLPELGVSLPFPGVLSSLQDSDGIQKKKIVVLVGTAGVSPIQSLVKATTQPGFPAEVIAVLSANANSAALGRYGTEGFATRVLGPQKDWVRINAGGEAASSESESSLEEVDVSSHLLACLQEYEADLLVILDDVDLDILSKDVRQMWCDKTLVLHSSLLPAFPGRDTHSRVLKAGVCLTGCTVHFLSEQGEEEPQILVQKATQVLSDDNAASLERRVIEDCEWKALPEAVQMFASGNVTRNRRRTSSFSNVTSC
jgi:phosphoribosylamine--glycine ligase/phosphoribosylglycinamide formyltransferase/phosphoribosylformylglycinamidine cyclo-ligase